MSIEQEKTSTENLVETTNLLLLSRVLNPQQDDQSIPQNPKRK